MFRPFVVLEPQETGFTLRSLGHGVALNIKVDDVIISKEQEVAIRFPKVLLVLTSGATAQLPAEGLKAGRTAGSFFLAHLDPSHATMTLDVRVRFQNAEMVPYVVSESVSPGELRVVEISTREAR